MGPTPIAIATLMLRYLMELLTDKLHITEQEMDFLILEELACSPLFAEWFLCQTGAPHAGAKSICSLRRSVSTWDGETDLLVVHHTESRDRALLIENKVGAAFTELQPERYRMRGQAGQASGEWADFATVLIAPQFFLTHMPTLQTRHNRPDAQDEPAFNFTISYEKIREAVASEGNSARIAFKVHLLDLAIAKAKTPWVKTDSVVITEFFRAFRKFALPKAPEVMWPPEATPRAPASNWIIVPVPHLPSRVVIEVKPANGVVDLRLYGVPEGKLVTTLPNLPCGAETAPARKSSAIRLRAPRMDPRAPFEGQEAEAKAHLSATRTLWAFAFERADAILRLLGDPLT